MAQIWIGEGTCTRQNKSHSSSFDLSPYYVPGAKSMSVNLIPTTTYEVRTIVNPISQRKKLRLSEVKGLS